MFGAGVEKTNASWLADPVRLAEELGIYTPKS
jgi:hypothetical protein